MYKLLKVHPVPKNTVKNGMLFSRRKQCLDDDTPSKNSCGSSNVCHNYDILLPRSGSRCFGQISCLYDQLTNRGNTISFMTLVPQNDAAICENHIGQLKNWVSQTVHISHGDR